MKEIKINIEGCMEDVAKVMKHLEQGGFLMHKSTLMGLSSGDMYANTTAMYEVMEDWKDGNEDRTIAAPFMPKKGEVCAERYSDGSIHSVFIATGEIEKSTMGDWSYLLSFVAIGPSIDLSRTIKLVTSKYWHTQSECRPATKEEADLLLKVIEGEGYFWDPIGCKLIKNKYAPKYRERYFAPDFDATAESPFSAIMYEWQGIDYDMDLLKKGWVFRTKEEAQALCDKLNKAVDGVEI